MSLRGHVCQLNYAGGGLLQHIFEGEVVRVPFCRAPRLWIGQEVSFKLSGAGAEQIEVHRVGGGPLEHLESTEKGGESTWRGARKLQRCIWKFQNARLSERLEMLSQAEETLEGLLAQAALDGDALCSLVSRVAGWLHAPRSVGSGAVGEQSQGEMRGDMQWRVRRLLISALSHLDLLDSTTRGKLEAAVAYITQLMKGHVFGRTSGAGRQWQQLERLLSQESGTEITPEVEEDTDVKARLKRKYTSLCFKDRAQLTNGRYVPNKKVRELAAAYCSEDQVVLQCCGCGHSLSSNWFWKHPTRGLVFCLKPQSGHTACKLETGSKKDYVALDSRPTVHDQFAKLDYCEHQRRRVECSNCGGRDVCPHGRLQRKCGLCKRLIGCGERE